MAALTVTDEPQRLDTTRDETDSFRRTSPMQSVIFRNLGTAEAQVVYIGDVGDEEPTSATGTPVYAGEWSPAIPLTAAEHIWVVAATGVSVAIRKLEVGI